MKVLIIGSTGGSGRAAVGSLLGAGHEVTAFVRKAGAFEGTPGVSEVVGDVMNAADVERAVASHDAVVVTLGIRENALKVRLAGAGATSQQVRSQGTQHVIAAMKKHGVRRLVVQSSYGVGPTRERLTTGWKLIFALLLKPQIADTEVQEQLVRESGLDWVLVQPVGLNDSADESAFTSAQGDTKSMGVSRRAVGKVLASLVGSAQSLQTLAVSA